MKSKILICDDDYGILTLIRMVLEEKGYEVDARINGEGLIEAIKEFDPQAILLDIWMPIAKGDKITAELKNDPKTKHIPIILISSSNNVAKIAEEVGAEGYLCKPFDIENLERLVEYHINPS